MRAVVLSTAASNNYISAAVAGRNSRPNACRKIQRICAVIIAASRPDSILETEPRFGNLNSIQARTIVR